MTIETPVSSTHHDSALDAFVTFSVANQQFGVPVTRVQDILSPDAMAPVPGGPPEVCGLINLRGRVVTVIDMRTRLSLGSRKEKSGPGKAGPRKSGMCVTVESGGEAYTLFVDKVGDVVNLPHEQREGNPGTLDAVWRDVAEAVYRTDQGLLVALNIDRLLAIGSHA